MCLVSQLYWILCDILDCYPPGYSVHGIFQVRILEWVVISSSRSSWPRDWILVSCVSCIAGRFSTHWAIRGTQIMHHCLHSSCIFSHAVLLSGTHLISPVQILTFAYRSLFPWSRTHLLDGISSLLLCYWHEASFFIPSVILLGVFSNKIYEHSEPCFTIFVNVNALFIHKLGPFD